MKKILNILLSVLFVGLSAQTIPPTGANNKENYIYSRTYLEATVSSSTTVKQVQEIQYFDGLGRLKQSIAIKATPLGKDIVVPIEYDGFGRQVKNYLPIPQSASTSNGSIYSNPLTEVAAFYGTEKIYSEDILENTPLDKVIQKIQPGVNWQNKPINYAYDTNASNEVLKFTTSTTWLDKTTVSILKLDPSSKTYPENQLYKYKVTDEDGNVSYEFKNGKGKTLLIKKILDPISNTSADTYYVYNEFDQLAFVISPLATEIFKNLAVGTIITTSNILDVNNLCYQYRYDNQNRLVEKKLPGKDWEYMVYDKQDRLVLSQDANLGALKQWLFTKYDQYGRVAFTGIYTSLQAYSSTGRSSEQTLINDIALNYVERKTAVGFTQNGLGVYYGNPSTSTSYPSSITALLSVNYYDVYPTGTPLSFPFYPSQILGQDVLLDASVNSGNISTKSLPVASMIKNIEDDGWAKSYTFYDTKGRAISSYSQNYLGGYTRVESLLDFSGTPSKVNTYHKRLATDTETTIKERFEYDGQNRLVKHFHQVNTNPEELLAESHYNEIGQIDNKKVGGVTGNPLQSVDYKYNIRGWLTGINLDASGNIQTNRLFSYKINYQEPLAVTNTKPYVSNQNLEIKPRYNGNISEITWFSGNDSSEPIKKYGYVYDGLNRLSAGFYYKKSGSNFLFTEENNEIINYDINGNITFLKRFGFLENNVPSAIDELVYEYSGNKLSKVTDNTDNYFGYPDTSGSIINYDANGNMISHADKGLTAINYNYLNLPKKITFSQYVTQRNGSKQYINTQFTYRADGVKIKKKHAYGSGTGILIYNTTDYLDGIEYFNNTIKFLPTAEGFYDFTNNSYIYQYKDHLGNVRISYSKNQSGGIDVLDKNDYYPFGLSFVNNATTPVAGGWNKYKYNGKELQETGMYDYGARFYMPDIGRWGVVDPLAEAYTKLSPYNYTLNNPIYFIDPDGTYVDTSEIYAKNKDGSYKNPNLVKAWNTFATSKDGINFLKDFVSAGQKIAGHEYKESGKFDKAGIDITFDNGKSVKEYNDTHIPEANGITTPKLMENGRLNFQVSVSNLPYTDQAIETISHEFAEHITPRALDFYDNKKNDFSKGYEALMDYKNGYTPQYYSKYYGDSKDKTSTTGLEHQMNDKTQAAEKLGVPIIQVLYQKNNIKRTDEQIKKILFSK